MAIGMCLQRHGFRELPQYDQMLRTRYGCEIRYMKKWMSGASATGPGQDSQQTDTLARLESKLGAAYVDS